MRSLMQASHHKDDDVLYVPGPNITQEADIHDYLQWLETEKRLRFTSWQDLHDWSIRSLEDFWESVWQWCDIRAYSPYTEVLTTRDMPGAQWFPGATLNYAEHCVDSPADLDDVAVVAYSQTRAPTELTFADVAEQVRRARAGLQLLGVGRGDRVVAYLPNIPETLIAFLATASLGAVWSSAAPEFGARSVVDRFAQLEPSVLLAVPGYTYGDRQIDRSDEVRQIREALPSLRHVITVPYGPGALEDTVDWDDLVAPTSAPLSFDPVPFDHPLYVLFSSGTTGLPKPIVHSHGGILIEHLKNHRLHWDLGVGDRLLWFTTTAWMMWNSLVSALLVGSGIVMVDGNPNFPDLRQMWRLAEETGATLMGASPVYLMACRKAGIDPAEEFDLGSLRQLGVVGSPFPPEGFRWVFDQFGDRILLNVGSGGTDVCTGLVQSSPLLPVREGAMSGASLGVDVKAFDDAGRAVVGELGELVITSPMPSMPVGFWGDEDGTRFASTYFDRFPGVFRFGDWCRFDVSGACRITGRADATLNRGGVRLGAADYYRLVEELPEIADSLVVHLEDPEGGSGELILFVVPAYASALTPETERRLGERIRTELSPRHLPDRIVNVSAVPYGRNGKKLEVPVKKILQGAAPHEVLSTGAMADADALSPYLEFATSRAAHLTGATSDRA
ncbi:acetoacetate--CoA ligase [Okibacterium endophyticum]